MPATKELIAHKRSVNQIKKAIGADELIYQNLEDLKKSLNKLGEEETVDYWNKSQGTRKNQVLETIWKQAIKGEIKYVQLLAWLGCLDK